MSQLLEFLQTHEEAFRSRSRLASLYSDFRFQRQTNPDGYLANVSAWTQALSAAAEAGLLSSQSQISTFDRFILHAGDELARALQTHEHGQPLAIGAVINEAVRNREILPLKGFLESKQTVYVKKSWIPTPWDVGSWFLRKAGVLGGEGGEDKLVKADFVILHNVETAAKAVIAQASQIATSNTSKVFSRELFSTTFATAVGGDQISATDLSVLLIHLSRDQSAIAYDQKTGTIRFRSISESSSATIGEEDINIASLRTLISSLEPQVTRLTDRITELDDDARKCIAKKQTASAKTALRLKKLAEADLQQRASTLAQVEEVYAKIEQASDQVEIVRIMEASTVTLRSLNKQTGGVEKVQDVMDGLREEMVNTEEITAAINEASAGSVDEGELEDELEEMEKVEREKREAKEKAEREAEVEKQREQRKLKEAEEVEVTRKRLEELSNPTEKAPINDSESTLIGDGTIEATETT